MSRHLHTDELFNDRRSVYLKYDTLKALCANSLGCRTWEKMSEQNTEFKRSSLSLMLQCKSNSMWRKNTRAQKKKGLGKVMRALSTRENTFSHSRSRILMAFVLKHLQDLEHQNTYWREQAVGQTIYSIKLVKKPWARFCLSTASRQS